MTESNGNISASPTLVKLAGADYLMFPLTDQDFGEFENWMRTIPIEIARENIARMPTLTTGQQELLLNKAMEISARINLGSPEGVHHTTSLDGAAYLIWLGLRKHSAQSQLTHQNVKKLLTDNRTIEEAMDKFDMINGLPEAKKKGRRQKSEKLKKAVDEATSFMIGKDSEPKSTDSSLINISGTPTPSQE